MAALASVVRKDNVLCASETSYADASRHRSNGNFPSISSSLYHQSLHYKIYCWYKEKQGAICVHSHALFHPEFPFGHPS